jgi:hypothetical protein
MYISQDQKATPPTPPPGAESKRRQNIFNENILFFALNKF